MNFATVVALDLYFVNKTISLIGPFYNNMTKENLKKIRHNIFTHTVTCSLKETNTQIKIILNKFNRGSFIQLNDN